VLQYVPAERTPFIGVRKLLPGTSMLWRDGEPHFSRYWSPPIGDPAPAFDLEGAKEGLRGRIRCAVAARLESEVPMGVFLSGGLDSSVIVAEMAEMGVPVETYSIGFEQPDLDESRHAATVAHHFGTDHTMLRVEDEASTLLEGFAGAYDEPFADSSALATLAVAKAAKDHVTVVLTGDGGDELFGGYERYRAHAVGQRLHDRLGPAATPAAAILQVTGALTSNHRLRAGAGFIAHPWSSYRDRMFHFSPNEVSHLMRRELLADVNVSQASDRLNSLWSQATDRWVPWVDAQTYLPDDLLTKMDRATMASSIEARSPLLDQDLWSWVANAPRNQLIDRRSGKNLLREAYRGVLPDTILDRPKKGFGIPLAAWLRTHLRPMLNERVARPGAPLHCLIEPAAAAKVVERFLAGDDRWTYQAWNLLALATWLEHRRSLL
jgi:asparagine synthase (glutamine-hydrolysing)